MFSKTRTKGAAAPEEGAGGQGLLPGALQTEVVGVMELCHDGF